MPPTDQGTPLTRDESQPDNYPDGSHPQDPSPSVGNRLASDRQLHYPGDCTSSVGQVVGPTLLGQLLTIYAADYDEASDVTTAHLRPATVSEVQAVTR